MLPAISNNSMEFPTNSTAPPSMATNIWEEHFQDLSFYCQDSNSIKDMSIGRENIIGPPDDELNTPEIDYEDFNFGSWSKPEPTEENYLWEDDNLGKIESDHYRHGSVLSEYQNCDLPDETNMGLISLNYSPEETVANQTTQCLSTIVEDSSEANCSQMSVKEDTYEAQNSFIAEAPELHLADALKPSVNIADAEIVSHTPIPAQENPNKAKLSLPLTVFENSIVLNTPDVLETLDHQPEFDIVTYILEEAANATTQIDSHSHPISNIVVKEETEEQIATEVMDLDDDSDEISVPDVKLASSERTSDESHVVVYPSSQNTPVRILITKHPATQASGSRSSRKRERKVKKKYIVVKESQDSSSDDEYTPPVKSKKRTASCSSKATDSECSRYRELRDRNNEASRKSRMNRKAREEEMKIQAAELEADNHKLKIRAEELEKLVDTLRKALLSAMVKGKD